jgi:hypothetical protein
MCENDWNTLLDHGLEKPASYIVRINGNYYEAIQGGTSSGAGTIAYGGADNAGSASGTDCAAVLNATIAACSQGDTIFVRSGDYTLTSSVNENVGISIIGEHGAGDLFFGADAIHGGYTTKQGVLFIDGDGTGIDMFKLGYATSGGANTMTFGHRLINLAFCGYAAPTGLADTANKANSAVTCSNIQSSIFQNLDFRRKEYGLYITATNDEFPLNWSDVLHVENCHFAYNVYGFYMSGAGGELRLNNIYGYINEKSVVYCSHYYDTKITNVFSNADAIQSAAITDAAVSVLPAYGDAYLSHIYINGEKSGGTKAYSGICVTPAGYTRSKIFLDHVLVQGVANNAIDVASAAAAVGTSVHIRDIYVGEAGGISTMGGAAGSAEVTWYVVNNADPARTTVYVDGGYADCEQANKWTGWFVDVYSVKNIENWSPLAASGGESIFDPTNNIFGPTVTGATATPAASTDYMVYGTDLFVTSTDSGNADAAILVKDSGGNTVIGPVSTLSKEYVPLGYQVNWGAYTGAAPTVTMYGI